MLRGRSLAGGGSVAQAREEGRQTDRHAGVPQDHESCKQEPALMDIVNEGKTG